MSIDPGVRNFAYAVLHFEPQQLRPRLLRWKRVDLQGATSMSRVDTYKAMVVLVQAVIDDCVVAFPGQPIYAVIESQLHTNLHTYPLVHFLLGYLYAKMDCCDVRVWSMAARTKVSQRNITKVWPTAHPQPGAAAIVPTANTMTTKAISVAFTEAFVASGGHDDAVVATWRSPSGKCDDLADALLQGVVFWTLVTGGTRTDGTTMLF